LHESAADLDHPSVGLLAVAPPLLGLEARQLAVAEPAEGDEEDVGEGVVVFVG
jgi:hypothetical protein